MLEQNYRKLVLSYSHSGWRKEDYLAMYLAFYKKVTLLDLRFCPSL